MENIPVQTEIDELKSIRRQSSIWRLSLFLVTVLFLVICASSLIGAFKGLAKNGEKQKEFVTELGTQMQVDVVPMIRDIAVEARQSVDINKEVATTFRDSAPKMANTAMQELRSLSTNVPENGRRIIMEEFEQAMKQQESTLRKEFPDATPEQLQTVMNNLLKETQVQVAVVSDELFSPYIKSMNNIIVDTDTIRNTVKPPSPDQIPVWEMAFLFVDILRAEMPDSDKLKINSPQAIPKKVVTPHTKPVAPKTTKKEKGR
jgi:hypothetical protein